MVFLFIAMIGSDFISTSGELTFSSDQMEVCCNIEIVNDEIPEPEETFQVRLTSSSILRAVIEDSDTTITITDTDRMYYLMFITILLLTSNTYVYYTYH